MDISVFNKNLEFIDDIDTAKSIIIAPKYYGCGDFEIYMSAALFKWDVLSLENYISYGDFFGVIEGIKIETDAENGNHVSVTGRNIESILDRRIVTQQTMFSGTVEDYIRKIINENCINPTNKDRIIPKLVLGEHKGYTDRIEIQCTYSNLLEHIIETCTAYGIGFKMSFDDASKDFIFDLYKGKDRSIMNTEGLPPVIFSMGYDNLLSTEYNKDISTLKNVALVAGEGEGSKRKNITIGSRRGLDRRECFIDARELSTNDGEVTQSEYEKQLKEKGNSALANFREIETIDGAIVQNQFIYGKDFFLGDTVTVKNEYGITLHPKVIEADIVEDETGFRINPIFEKEGDDDD